MVGSSATGLPTGIVAEAENHIGGHAICSGGNLPLGGGNSYQKKYGVDDSPDLLFRDLIDWSVVEPNGAPPYRYNDHEIVRAFADNSVAAFDFLLAHGVTIVDQAPDNLSGHEIGMSAPRTLHCAIMDWPMIQNGKLADPAARATTASGSGLMLPLHDAALKAGVKILLRHRLTAIHREAPQSGRVTGIAADHNGAKLNLRAQKAVIVGPGGSSGNVNFRRMFDPRLTEEYCGLAGMPYSNQDASGELAAIAINASLWGLFNFTSETGSGLTKPGQIGCQYGYVNLRWMPGSPMFSKARASGLRVSDWQNVITVNMLGKRFYDETGRQYTANSYKGVDPYRHGSYLNAKNVRFEPNNWINAAMAGIGDGHNGGGPIWAIFDSAAVEREKWDPKSPNVDIEGGFFFSADTVAELAKSIQMKYQRVPMPVQNLEETVGSYNGFVAAGRDYDFGKPRPLYTIAKPPFYAAWATPVIHDTRAGLRINGNCQVVDLHAEAVAG